LLPHLLDKGGNCVVMVSIRVHAFGIAPHDFVFKLFDKGEFVSNNFVHFEHYLAKVFFELKWKVGGFLFLPPFRSKSVKSVLHYAVNINRRIGESRSDLNNLLTALLLYSQMPGNNPR
jgi:hypothetical protein